ncbi:MAG: major capsid protein [Desulfobacteraceae bacterium]|nr:major capsid protein [Desulfobacteraceae bacterium]
MPQPTPSDAHVNAPLTSISIAWMQDENEFIADKVFPQVSVKKQSDRYYKYDRDNWFRAKAQIRAPSTESAGGGYTVDNTPTYYADVYAFHIDVDDQLRANADSVLSPDRDATEFVTRDLSLKKELTWAARYFTTGVWTGSTTGGDVTPGTLWDAAASTPIEDLRAQLLATKRRTGFRANKVTMSDEVWNVLQDHPDFLDRIKYTQTAVVAASLLAAVLAVDEVLIAGSVNNIAIEGAAEDMQFIFGKNVLVSYAAKRPGLMTPTAGYTFAWSGLFGAGAAGARVLRFRMEHLKSDRVEGEMAYDQKVVAPEMGAFLAGVIS